MVLERFTLDNSPFGKPAPKSLGVSILDNKTKKPLVLMHCYLNENRLEVDIVNEQKAEISMRAFQKQYGHPPQSELMKRALRWGISQGATHIDLGHLALQLNIAHDPASILTEAIKAGWIDKTGRILKTPSVIKLRRTKLVDFWLAKRKKTKPKKIIPKRRV